MPALKVTLCLGSSCHARGNRHHVASLAQRFGERGVEFELRGSLCLGRCAEGPVVLIDGEVVLDPGAGLESLIEDRLVASQPTVGRAP